MPRLLAAAFVSTVALAAGCDNRVTVVCDGDGGSGGASNACPAAPPPENGACQPEGMACAYGAAECVTQATCQAGAWKHDQIGESCHPCPAELPKQFSSCSAWPAGTVCKYPSAQCPGGEDHATCAVDTWDILPMMCNPPPPTSGCRFLTQGECDLDPSCVWYQPGCGFDPIWEAGCFDNAPCQSTIDCYAPNDVCQTLSIHPCIEDPCNACDQPVSLCHPAPTP